jgi:hypothetical protein
MRFALLVFVLAMFGCTTETRTASVERTSGVQNGQPVELITTRTEQAKAETSADIGPLVNAAVSAAMGDVRGALRGVADQVGSLTARPQPVQADELAKLISASSAEAGLDPTTGAALGGAGGLALLALREWAASRANRRDSDEAWEEIKRNARNNTTSSPETKA